MKASYYKQLDKESLFNNGAEPGALCLRCRNALLEDYIRFEDGNFECISCLRYELHSYYQYDNDTYFTKEVAWAILRQEKRSITKILTLLSKFPYYKGLLGYEKNKKELLQSICSFLGFSGHPLSHLIRELAVNICHYIGPEVVPACLNSIGTKPDVWQMDANIALVISEIEANNSKVQEQLTSIWATSSEPALSFLKQHLIKAEQGIYPKDATGKLKEQLEILHSNYKSISDNRFYSLETGEETELFYTIKQIYPLKTLRFFYNNYLHSILEVTDPKLKSKNKSPVKKDLSAILALVFCRKELLSLFLGKLPGDCSNLFRELSWRNISYNIKTYQEYHQKEILKISPRGYHREYEIIDPHYDLFQINIEDDFYSYKETEIIMYLHPCIRNFTKHNLPEPEWSKLNFVNDPVRIPHKKNQQKITRNEEVNSIPPADYMEKLNVLHKFMINTPVDLTSTGKIKAAYLKKIISVCGINEFFADPEEKKLRYLKASMAINHLLKSGLLEHDFSTENLKKSFYNLISWPEVIPFFMKQFLTYLKFDYSEYRYILCKQDPDYSPEVMQAICTLTKKLSSEQWVQWENLFLHAEYHNLFPMILHPMYKHAGFYYTTLSPEYYDYREKIYVKSDNAADVVINPFLKCWFFYLASLGLVEIFSDEPQNIYYQTAGKSYLSLFDGLKAVKLTKIGAYILDKSDEKPDVKDSSTFKAVVDDEYLIIKTIGSDKVNEYLLKEAADQVRPDRYHVSYASFLKNCHTLDDVETKITMLKDVLGKNLPSVWNTFFSSVKQRMHPLQEVNIYQLFTIENDQRLLHILHTDPLLKENTLKAENYHILIRKTKLNAVKKKLLEEGYIL